MSAQAADIVHDKAPLNTLDNPTRVGRANVAKQDDATVLADTPYALSSESLKDMEATKILVRINRGSISQSTLDTNPAFQQKDANGDYLPIYVMPDVGDRKQTAVVIEVGEGQKVVVANEGIHNWDTNYVDTYIRQVDTNVASNKEYIPADKYKPSSVSEGVRYQELIRHIENSVAREKLGETRVIISTEPGITDAYTLTTKEGTNYIVIPAKELDALANASQTERLEGVIDNLMPDFKKFDNSQEVALIRHSGDQYLAQNTDKDNKIRLSNDDLNAPSLTPQAIPSLSQASIDLLIKEKLFIPVQPNELVGVKISDFTDQNGKPLPPDTPIYLVSGANGDFKSNGAFLSGETTDPGHKPYILIDEKMHQQNSAYVREHVMQKDEDVDRWRVDGSLTAIDHNIVRKLKLPKDTQILASTDEAIVAAYSFETETGNKYIILPRDVVAGASKLKANPEDLQKIIDAQTRVLQRGDNSVEGLVRANDADRLMADYVLPNDASRDVLPSPNIHIDNSALENLARTGRLVLLSKDDLAPGVAEEITKVKDANGNLLPPDTPIYLVPNINRDGVDQETGVVMTTKEGKTYILVNERGHTWTSDSVELARDVIINADISTPSHERELMKPEDILKDVMGQAKTLEEAAAIKRRYDDLINTTNIYAANTAVGKEVMLIAVGKDGVADYTPTGASSVQSKEGTKYIFISREQFEAALTSDNDLAKLKFTMGHETTHNQHGDSLPPRSQAENDMSVAHEYEMRADLGGASSLVADNPLALSRVYEEDLLQVYNQQYPNNQKQKLTDKEMEQISQSMIDASFDPGHPSRWELIQALRHEDQLMREYEVKYEAEHGHKISDEAPEIQKKIRAAEAQQVEDQTIVYMKTRQQNWNYKPLIVSATPLPKDAGPTSTTAEVSSQQNDSALPPVSTNGSAPLDQQKPVDLPDPEPRPRADQILQPELSSVTEERAVPAKPHKPQFSKLRSTIINQNPDVQVASLPASSVLTKQPQKRIKSSWTSPSA